MFSWLDVLRLWLCLMSAFASHGDLQAIAELSGALYAAGRLAASLAAPGTRRTKKGGASGASRKTKTGDPGCGLLEHRSGDMNDSGEIWKDCRTFEYVAGYKDDHGGIPAFPDVAEAIASRVAWAAAWVWRSMGFHAQRPKLYHSLYSGVRHVNKALLFGLFSTVHVRGGSCAVSTMLWDLSAARYIFVVAVAGVL
jgi:hypothetical protein